MDNLHGCLLDVRGRRVPGDLAEIGVWRGGAAIMMSTVLKGLSESHRKVWLADPFRACPSPMLSTTPPRRGMCTRRFLN